MQIKRMAFICLVTTTISACNFSSTHPESVTSQPTPIKKTPQAAFELAKNDADPDNNNLVDAAKDFLQKDVATQTQNELWSLIRDNLQLDRNTHRQGVADKVIWFARNQDYLDRVAERAQPYLYHIVTKLRERNMPLDLALLPIVESAYQPFAYSPSHAAGIWQFIPGTGKHYGLKQNWWYDGRRDIIAATDAALNYLESLHKRFNGNWFHALAAYNAGEGNVERAIRKNKRLGKKIDFWSLRLPKETRGYVPSLLAVAEVLKESEKHQISFKAIPNQPYFERIDVGSQIDLAIVAQMSGLTIDEIYTLNPGFSRWATDPDGPHHLLIPLDGAQQFKIKLAALPDSERISWTQHIIKQGESLGLIARRYQTSVAALKETNRLRGNLIRTGHALLIPTAKQSSQFYSLSADARKFKGLSKTGDGKRYVYTVKRGDNLWDIGRSYGISVKELTTWNGISSKSLLRSGQKLTVWVEQEEGDEDNLINAVATRDPVATHDSRGTTYIVQRGDSLWLIARKFDTRVKNLLEWNNIHKGKTLKPGQTLIVQPALAGA